MIEQILHDYRKGPLRLVGDVATIFYPIGADESGTIGEPGWHTQQLIALCCSGCCRPNSTTQCLWQRL